MSLKHLFYKGLYWSGAAMAYSRIAHTKGAIVLMYHSIVTAAEASWIDPSNSLDVASFEKQMRFLSNSRRVLSMSELVAKMQCGDRLEPGTVAITFDDGYLDNLRNEIGRASCRERVSPRV